MSAHRTLGLVVALLALIVASACEEEPSGRNLGPMESMGKIPNLKDVQGQEPTREDYIRASIQLGCLPRTMKEANLKQLQYNQQYESILEQNRFKDRKHYLKVKTKFAADRDAKDAINIGVMDCMGVGQQSRAMHDARNLRQRR